MKGGFDVVNQFISLEEEQARKSSEDAQAAG